ncbi:MAG TPA: hypothetical protein VM031_04535 [Phycisphaerae bacterium]|nr:hypothetical protein [Phycisphaerae bacterium]
METGRIAKQAAAWWAAVLLPCLGLTAAELVPVRQEGVLACPLVAEAPKIDGRLDDAAWAKAQPLRHFAYKTQAVAYQTEGWVCRDATRFYLAARCHDDNLPGLVAEFEGRALWKNDCIELFVVAERRELFFSHLIVDCRGRTSGGTWVPDEWGEPTRGKALQIAAAAGREKAAWTVELAVPVAAFGFPVTDQSIWALGFNREKHGEPAEVSSFQGGFNRPKEYPDLRFDGRAIVADGLGLRNLGDRAQRVALQVTAGDRTSRHELDIAPGRREPYPIDKLLPTLAEGSELTIEVFGGSDTDTAGKPLVRERYVLAPAKQPAEPIDVTKLPPAKFAPSALDDPSFFPVGVWAQPAGIAEKYKAMGVNVYVGGSDSYPRPRGRAFLDAVAAQGMKVICGFNAAAVEEKLHQHPAFLGWMFGDEPDNVDRATGQVKHTPEALLADFARIRRADPAHRVYLNLGCGVADERFVGRGATDEQYAAYPQACDIVSYDVYPCNSIQPDGPDRLHLVAKGIERLRKWAGPRKAVWCWIEANKIHKGPGRAPTPEEARTQIWMALVHGADGYGFFCHSWAGPKMLVSGIEPDMQAALAKVNAEVHALAAVLKAETIDGAATVTAARGGRVDVLVKRHGGATYVFAVNMRRKPETAAIALRGAAGAEAEVLFEGRSVAVEGGTIRDEFAPYAVHRYKVRGPAR